MWYKHVCMCVCACALHICERRVYFFMHISSRPEEDIGHLILLLRFGLLLCTVMQTSVWEGTGQRKFSHLPPGFVVQVLFLNLKILVK